MVINGGILKSLTHGVGAGRAGTEMAGFGAVGLGTGLGAAARRLGGPRLAAAHGRAGLAAARYQQPEQCQQPGGA